MGAALLAGCGSSSSSSTAARQGSSTVATAATTSSSTTATAPSASSTQGSPSEQAKIAACKATLSTQRGLPTAIRTKLEGDCVKVAGGDKAALKRAVREVCEAIIRTSALPAGPARERALAACNQAK